MMGYRRGPQHALALACAPASQAEILESLLWSGFVWQIDIVILYGDFVVVLYVFHTKLLYKNLYGEYMLEYWRLRMCTSLFLLTAFVALRLSGMLHLLHTSGSLFYYSTCLFFYSIGLSDYSLGLFYYAIGLLNHDIGLFS